MEYFVGSTVVAVLFVREVGAVIVIVALPLVGDASPLVTGELRVKARRE